VFLSSVRNEITFDSNICINIQYLLIPLCFMYVGAFGFVDTCVCIVQVKVVPRTHNVQVIFVNTVTETLSDQMYAHNIHDYKIISRRHCHNCIVSCLQVSSPTQLDIANFRRVSNSCCLLLQYIPNTTAVICVFL